MDNSKMAKANTTIEYDMFKEEYDQDQLSRPVKQRCRNHCYDDECKCEKGLDEVLAPSPADPYEIGCSPSRTKRRELS